MSDQRQSVQQRAVRRLTSFVKFPRLWTQSPFLGQWTSLLCLGFILSACSRSSESPLAAEKNSEPGPQETEGMLSSPQDAEDPYETAERDFNKASEHLQAGQYEAALPLLKKAVLIDAENEEVHYRMAFCLAKLKRPEEAIEHYQRTLEIFPDYAEAHNNLGNLLMNQRKYAEAEPHFREAIAGAPDMASAHNNLGSLLSRQGRIPEAIPFFTESLRLNPSYLEAYYNLGNAYLTQGRTEEAIIQFSRALKLRPGFPPAIKALQKARTRNGSIPLP